jgi:hypothetical protein
LQREIIFTRRRGDRGGFGTDQSPVRKKSDSASSASSAPPREPIEFLGLWEQINNPGFNPVEFDGIRMQAGLNSFTLTPKQCKSDRQGRTTSQRAQQPGTAMFPEQAEAGPGGTRRFLPEFFWAMFPEGTEAVANI